MVPPPARPFPDSYRQLNEFAERYAVGAMVYARDSVPAHCYVLLNGRVVLEGGLTYHRPMPMVACGRRKENAHA